MMRTSQRKFETTKQDYDTLERSKRVAQRRASMQASAYDNAFSQRSTFDALLRACCSDAYAARYNARAERH